ncbi:hypothetical protein C8F01DRAFT_676034 [Mycena amicta]|nr:hypothetical protein C8F01DRAFT_676034 [Mycena amicta]
MPALESTCPLSESADDGRDNNPWPGGFREADQEAGSDIFDAGRKWRILVAGRETAGKTFLLRRICAGSYQSGENDIEAELPHPCFIFHDSPGFQGSDGANIRLVKAFLKTRASASKMSERVHAIWYCIPTDTSLYLSSGDEHFFNENVAEHVPIIVVFTKYDGLVTMAFGELRRTLGRVEAKEKRFEKAQALLQSHYIDPLESTRFPPIDFVHIFSDTTSFEELIETTQRLLSGDTLKPMALSVRQTNLDICVERAVHEALDAKDLPALLSHVLPHYPHIWRVSLTLVLANTC